MDRESPTYRRQQALHALNGAIAYLMMWPPDDDTLGAAVFFTALALHRLAQADVDGKGADFAESVLKRELGRRGEQTT